MVLVSGSVCPHVAPGRGGSLHRAPQFLEPHPVYSDCCFRSGHCLFPLASVFHHIAHAFSKASWQPPLTTLSLAPVILVYGEVAVMMPGHICLLGDDFVHYPSHHYGRSAGRHGESRRLCSGWMAALSELRHSDGAGLVSTASALGWTRVMGLVCSYSPWLGVEGTL